MSFSSGYNVSGMNLSNGNSSPYVEIIEQPASKALRFRYECEGRSAGSIPGANSSPELKTYPTIRVCNYRGRGIVIVSCVTKDQPYRPHPHSLVGKDTCTSGVCHVQIMPDNPTVSFVNLGIQCVKKKDIADALGVREKIRVDPFGTGFEHKKQPSSVDLNAIRMCFQVFIEGREGKFNIPLKPVVSEPIYDKKAMSDLTICKLSHYCASVAGDMEMIVLCEKVTKDNIQVRFFEKRDGRDVWEGYGDFKSVNVHKQVAITFRTPSYNYRQIEDPLQVYIQLRRPSDGATSEPLPFKFLPLDTDDPGSLKRKRKRFDDNPRATTLRRIQVEAESESSLLSDSDMECSAESLTFEARIQTIPLGGVHENVNNGTSVHSPTGPHIDGSVCGDQQSPVSVPSPAVDHSAYDGHCIGIHAENVDETFGNLQNNQGFSQQHPQQSLNMQRSEHPQFADCCFEEEFRRHQVMALQKLTLPYQTSLNNANQPDVELADAETDLIDFTSHQNSSFEANLNHLDSAELVAFGDALSKSLQEAMLVGVRTGGSVGQHVTLM